MMHCKIIKLFLKGISSMMRCKIIYKLQPNRIISFLRSVGRWLIICLMNCDLFSRIILVLLMCYKVWPIVIFFNWIISFLRSVRRLLIIRLITYNLLFRIILVLDLLFQIIFLIIIANGLIGQFDIFLIIEPSGLSTPTGNRACTTQTHTHLAIQHNLQL